VERALGRRDGCVEAIHVIVLLCPYIIVLLMVWLLSLLFFHCRGGLAGLEGREAVWG
jgi:hypothetical protein